METKSVLMIVIAGMSVAALLVGYQLVNFRRNYPHSNVSRLVLRSNTPVIEGASYTFQIPVDLPVRRMQVAQLETSCGCFGLFRDGEPIEVGTKCELEDGSTIDAVVDTSGKYFGEHRFSFSIELLANHEKEFRLEAELWLPILAGLVTEPRHAIFQSDKLSQTIVLWSDVVSSVDKQPIVDVPAQYRNLVTHDFRISVGGVASRGLCEIGQLVLTTEPVDEPLFFSVQVSFPESGLPSVDVPLQLVPSNRMFALSAKRLWLKPGEDATVRILPTQLGEEVRGEGQRVSLIDVPRDVSAELKSDADGCLVLHITRNGEGGNSLFITLMDSVGTVYEIEVCSAD